MNSSISNFFTLWAIRFGRLAHLLPLLAMALFLGSNPELRAQNGFTFTYDTNQTGITITGYTGAGGAVTIPAKLNGLPVTRIGDYSFSHRSAMTQITLPDSLTTIGVYAFYGCRGLTQIAFPESLTSIGK
ncbi:MAG: leucine-rich repeat domain-containing protein, partial [Verrucomicrobiae bacterium]|nr:leucine-rich repeat domain-containing protein [Verrucomicrobiae bacterium]